MWRYVVTRGPHVNLLVNVKAGNYEKHLMGEQDIEIIIAIKTILMMAILSAILMLNTLLMLMLMLILMLIMMLMLMLMALMIKMMDLLEM